MTPAELAKILVRANGKIRGDDRKPWETLAAVAIKALAPKTLGDAVKVARSRWYEEHGGLDTVQVLVRDLEQEIARRDAQLRQILLTEEGLARQGSGARHDE